MTFLASAEPIPSVDQAEASETKTDERMSLREYQSDALLQVQSLIMRGKKVLLQMPTGSGKTVMAAKIVQLESAHSTVWFLCHRREIIKQTAINTFAKYGIDYGIVSPEYLAEPGKRVQVASIQTLIWRRFNLPDPDIIIWDEAHHLGAPSWNRLMRLFPNARHIGLTATPERLDGKGLDEWFDDLVCGPSIRTLIEQKHLADYRLFAPTIPDLSAARKQFGDYNADDLDKVMNTPIIIGDAVDHYVKHVNGRRALAFATSVQASKSLVERFEAKGIAAVHVDGKTPANERSAAVENLEAGRIAVLSNYGVFTEGFDLPAIDAVILLRPTKSLTLYLQMVGRGLRMHEGKTTILDHAGLFYEHGGPSADWEWSLGGGARSRRSRAFRARGEGLRRCPKCFCAHERAEVCEECGYQYPTGREVGEFDGVLQEVPRQAPELGYEPKTVFAKRMEVSTSTVNRWLERGMPANSLGHIHTATATQWVHENVIPPGHETQSDFSRRIGRDKRTVRQWIGKGLPNDGRGHVKVIEGVEWYNDSPFRRSEEVRNSIKSGNFITVASFAKSLGVSGSTVMDWIQAGMPCKTANNESSGHSVYGIDAVAATEWRAKFVKQSEDQMEVADFANLFGVSRQTIYNWRDAGMPTLGRNGVSRSDALKWVEEHRPKRGRKRLSDKIKNGELK